MITIKASILESIRKDPEAYGRLLAIGDGKSGGGSHGMFAYLVDTARAVHIGKFTLQQAVRELHSKFLRFKDSFENRERQERLIEQLVTYLKHYNKRGFEWHDGARRIQWGITSDVILTGLTPWVVSDKKIYHSYLMAEHTFNWQQQLRFPLFQQFLSNSTIECPPEEIQIGIYFADTNIFDMRSFNTKELKLAVDETGILFNSLYNEYQKRKK
jgi:hypothetical protein